MITPEQIRMLSRASVPVAVDGTGAVGMERDVEGLSVLLELARSAPPMPEKFAAHFDSDTSPQVVGAHVLWALEWAVELFARSEKRLASLRQQIEWAARNPDPILASEDVVDPRGTPGVPLIAIGPDSTDRTAAFRRGSRV